MKPLRILLTSALLFFILASTAFPTLAQPVPPAPAPTGSAAPTVSALPAPGSPAPFQPATQKKVFVPLVQKQDFTSFDLIDRDVAGGKITAEQALIYKAYALFSDAALPFQYNARVPEDGEAVMRQIGDQWAGLSAATQAALTPFFVPPSYPGSWYTRPKLGAMSAATPQDTSADSWQFVSAVGGKVRVYYWSANASDHTKATAVAAAFDDRIWSKETTLMSKVPIPSAKTGAINVYLWSSYQRYSGTVVPFADTTLGITVAPKCWNTESTIYLNDYLPTGTIISPGMIQVAAHEFFHAIQNSFTLAACHPYDWVSEATATWAEDYVYPLADSEHSSAEGYLTYPERRLDNTDDLHEYGAYLLFYFLTHTVDTSASVIRHLWENAAGTANPYKAMDDAVNQAKPAMHDYYWSMYLASLWNIDPFTKYYETNDRLQETVVAQDWNNPIQIKTPSGEQITPLPVSLPTGAAIYYHLTFPDSSVHSVTVLNGLGYKLRIGSAWDDPWLGGWTDPGAQTYLMDDLANSNNLKGVNLVLLIKMAGKDGAPVYQTITPDINFDNDGFCLDTQGKIEDMVVIQSNSDWAHPDRILAPTGLPTTVYANNIPCYKIGGTSTYTDNNDGELRQISGSVNYTNNMIMPPGQTVPVPEHVWPDIELEEVSAQANWSISGPSNSKSWYTGSGSYTAGAAANCTLRIFQGVLPGGPSYRGYLGCGDPNPGAQISYVYHWIDDQNVEHQQTETDSAWRLLDIDLAVDYHGQSYPVSADGSTLSASGTHTYDWGDTETWDWSLKQQQ